MTRTALLLWISLGMSVISIGGMGMAFWWNKSSDPRPGIAQTQPFDEHLGVEFEAAPALGVSFRPPLRGESGPDEMRSMTVRFPWGVVEGDRRGEWFSLGRRWWGYVDVKETRGRSVKVDADKPLADQVLRPEIAIDVERAIAAMLAEDAKPLPDTFTDAKGRTWRLQR